MVPGGATPAPRFLRAGCIPGQEEGPARLDDLGHAGHRARKSGGIKRSRGMSTAVDGRELERQACERYACLRRYYE
jgi:hypothetical protein